MKYGLEDLLKVRKFREDSARNEVMVKKHLLDEAINLVQAKERKLREYQCWRVRTEEAMYDEIRNTFVSLKELDELKLQVSLMREKEISLEKDLMDAVNAREKANEDLAKAKEVYNRAVKEKTKIEEHREVWSAGMVREEEISQEKELEDIRRPGTISYGEEDYDEGF